MVWNNTFQLRMCQKTIKNTSWMSPYICDGCTFDLSQKVLKNILILTCFKFPHTILKASWNNSVWYFWCLMEVDHKKSNNAYVLVPQSFDPNARNDSWNLLLWLKTLFAIKWCFLRNIFLSFVGTLVRFLLIDINSSSKPMY